MHLGARIVVFLTIGFSGYAALATASNVPEWADRRLPHTEGLLLWLDASAQAGAARALGVKSRNTGDSLEYWYDSSGFGRNVRQPDAEARPTFRLEDGIGSIRFNGHGANFSLGNLGLSAKNLTTILVVAPFQNAGNFRGMISMRAKGQDDFISGMNVDLGPYGSAKFDTVNVEGAGASGVQNLRLQAAPFSQFHRLCVVSAVGARGVNVFVDGQQEGTRARSNQRIHMDEVAIGARHYGGDAARGFFAGEIAEVLVYDRALEEPELTVIDKYLADKYQGAGPIPPLVEPPAPGTIARVESPPTVQMLVPGFAVCELPIKLSNINNVLYRNDGKLIALGYDGNIHLLTDTDGDGLEDKDELFWENKGQLIAPIGMALTPPGYEYGRGVAVAAKGKCTLIVDTDGDDRADKEIVAASGWPQTPHPVDALGVAFDPRDHAIFFGLGTPAFTDPYVLRQTDHASYRLDGERGTIMRIAPDLKSRKIVATGIRFPVAIRFNAAGDLFCTDQEGATWLANGNPFDELLHIEQGRHYGFPPRHPHYLPNVIDEPSVFDYRPQHQSTCGLNFNEPGRDGAIFGPQWWGSDAFVTGYSRGKLYRTKLASTASGYVAQNQLLATLTMLPADACVVPGGSLVVAVHSGGPDWGSGPSGAGKLFKITRLGSETPLPSLVWANGPQEVRIAFDRPIDSYNLKGLASRIAIEGGEFVAAGDRLETVRPGYAAVEHQQNAPRFPIDIEGVQLASDRRTLILSTAPQLAAVNYAIAMREVRPSHAIRATAREIPQLPDVDLQYDLTGVEATWLPQTGEKSVGWLPHLDLDVSRAFTAASLWHEEFWSQLAQPGTLQLKSTFNLRSMLRPAVQIGSTIDYKLPDESVTLTFKSNCKFDLSLDGKTQTAAKAASGSWSADRTVVGSAKNIWPLEIRLHHGAGQPAPTLTVSYHTQEDQRARALAINRFILPWARSGNEAQPVVDNQNRPELVGGNWLRGEAEFFGAEAGCSKCHTFRGKGGTVGPDLSNLPKRDYASVVRDVTQPSFAINPDYVAQVVVTADGRVLTGTVRTDKERLVISDQQAKETVLKREDIEEIHASDKSIMPEGIPKLLGPDRLRDLLSFLLVEPPRMPVYGELTPPAPRSLHEVESVLAGSSKPVSTRSLGIVLVAGPKDHGVGEHDYPNWQTVWRSLLQIDDKVRIATANPWPSKEDLKTADVLVFYQQGAWTPERAGDIDAFLKRGGGLVYIHFAVDGGADPAGFAERIGLAWKTGQSKFRHGLLTLDFGANKNIPISRNIKQVQLYDESYWNLVGNKDRVNLLATGSEENQPQPLMWTFEPKIGGRVFVSVPGHFAWTFDDPIFRTLLLRGIAWTANEPVDRFNELVLPGARVKSAAP
jgi:putative heme-binding domain-containing protein